MIINNFTTNNNINKFNNNNNYNNTNSIFSSYLFYNINNNDIQ